MAVREQIDMATCPRCHKEYTEYPALSRRDNKTNICSRCGQTEALEDYFGVGFHKG